MFAVKPLACTSQDHVANCFMHNKLCQVHRPREELQNPAALVVNSAGTCCQAWSPEGGRSRHAHDSMHPLAIWLTQRRELAQQQQESMFFQENAPSFDVRKCIVKPLEDTHDVLYVHTGPRTFGWPANRHRLLTAGLSRQELVWVGPDTQEGIQQQFDSMFSRRCLLTGSIFFQASQDDIASWAQELADKRFRGNSQPLPTSGRGMLTACLSPGQLQRLEAYKKVYLQRCALDGTMLADLDHWPDSPGPAAGPNFPTLLRHGCIVDLNRPERIAQNVDRWLSWASQLRILLRQDTRGLSKTLFSPSQTECRKASQAIANPCLQSWHGQCTFGAMLCAEIQEARPQARCAVGAMSS